MLKVLESARELDAQRAAKQAAERARLLATARQMAIGVCTGKNAPTADQIVGLCDSLGASLDWFSQVCANCQRRADQAAGIDQVPGLRHQAEQLEAEARKLESAAEEDRAAVERALNAVKNHGDRTFSPWRMDCTPEELAAFRNANVRHMETCHRFWLAQRDASLIRKQIGELEAIDRNLIDHQCGEKPPHDFVLPPIG